MNPERQVLSTIERRTVLRGGVLSALGLGAAALIGCGDDNSADAIPETAAPSSSSPLAADVPRGPAGYPFNFPEPDKAPKAGGTLHWANSTFDPGPMDVAKASSGGVFFGPTLAYNGLLQLKSGPEMDPLKRPQLEPQLADSWETTPDGLNYTFKIHPGIKYHNVSPIDGRAFRANDVKLVYERYQREGDKRVYFENMESIEAPSDTSLTIKIKRPQPDFLFPLATHNTLIYPMELVDLGVIEKQAIGTGPFIIESIQTSVGMQAVGNKEYWENTVYLDAIDAPFVPDRNAALAGFRTEQFDFGATVESAAEIEVVKRTNPDIQVQETPKFYATFFLAMNMADPRFADERVRRALRMAIDKDELNTIVYQGTGVHAPGMNWTYLFDSQPPDSERGQWSRFSLSEAKDLLNAAGSENLSFDMIYSMTYGNATQKTCEVVQQQLGRAGVKVNLKGLDYQSYSAQWIGRQLQQAAHGWQPYGYDADTYFGRNLQSTSTANRFTINDPDIDRWADEQSRELDPATRKEIWRKIWDRVYDKMYRVEFPEGNIPAMYQPWLRNYRSGVGDSGNYLSMAGRQMRRVWLDK